MKKTILALLLSVLMITGLFAQQLTDGFETWPSPNWNLIESSTINTISQSSTYANTGTYSLRFSSYSSADSYDQYIVSNELNWTDLENEFSFYHRKYSYGTEYIAVGWSTTGNDIDNDFTWSETIEPGSTWAQYLKTDLPAETKYVAIHYFSDYAYYCYIDDVVLGNPTAGTPDAPLLVSPADGATNVAIDATLEWTTGASTDHAVLYIAEDAAFTSPTTVDPATSPHTTSLDNATTYYWKVVAVNGALENSSAVRSFTTALAEGTYIMELIDSYGDGWNGALIDILLDDVVIFDDATVVGDVNYLLFEAELGQTISTDFHTPGSYPSECSFNLYDYQETLLASGDQNTDINYFLAFPGSPDVPTLVSPEDGATNVALVSDLEWTTGENTDAATLYLADNEEFTSATEVPLTDTDTLYTTSSLAYNTTYYWKVVAHNTVDMYDTPSAVWSFTTEYGVATIPYSQNFDSYEAGDQPDGWMSINTTTSTTVVTSVSTTYPVSTPNSYRIYNAYASSGNILVSTPKVQTAGNRLRFSARTSTTLADSVIVGTMTDATDELTFVPIDTLALTTTHSMFMVELPDTAGEQYVTFKHARIGTARSIYLDNVYIEEIPQVAVIEFSPESIDCGMYLVGDTTAVAQTITVTNVGAVAAEITEITAGNASYFEVINENTLPYILEPQASMTVDVKALTSFVGTHDSYVRLKEKIGLFSFTNHDVDVTSEILSSQGDDHNDPFILNVAPQIVVNHTTTPYNATYAFCGGPSVVYKLTLPQSKLMDISLEGSDFDTKLWVFNSFVQIDTAIEDADAWYVNDDSPGGTGGSRYVEEEKGSSRALWSEMTSSFALAGDYYIVVSGYGSNSGDYVMTINTEDLPAPAAASGPYPSDDDVDLPTNFNLTWSNADYTETVDIYFGPAGNMTMEESNIPAVEEYEAIGLIPNTEYEWKIINRNYTGETPELDVVTWSFTTIGNAPDSTEYTAPADDAVDVAVNGTLYWQAVDGADGYNVYLSTDSLFAGVTPIDQAGTSYAYSGEYSQTYYWKVIPYNAVGPAVGTIEVWSFTITEHPFPEADLVFDGMRATSQGLPMEPGTANTTSQSIYYQSELNFEDSAITSISYLYNNYSAFTEEIAIYMGHTVKTSFSGAYDWELDDMTLVYNGDLTATIDEPIVNIDLDTPFIYNNTDNLVVTFMALETGSQSYSADFYNYPVTGNRSIRVSSLITDSVPYGTLKAYLPVTGFNYEELSQEAVFTVSADTLTYVDQIMDTDSNPQTVTITNSGLGDLGIVSIAINGTNADQFVLTDGNTYPATLATGENMSVQVVYAPTTDGDHTAQLVITDNLAREIHTVELVGNSIDTNIYAEDLPWSHSFEEDESLLGWYTIIESSTTSASITLNTSATNVQDGARAIQFYNSYDLTPNLQLITPNIVPDMGGYRLRFWMKGDTGSEMILAKYDTELTVLTAIDTFDVPVAYEQTTVEFEGTTTGNERFAFIPVFAGTYDYVYLDNITFEETPLTPVAELNVEAIDFGEVELTYTSVAEEVTITNVGPGTLNISNVEIIGTDADLFAWEYVEETPDMALENGETLELTVTFTPDALGLKEATLVINDDLNRNVRVSYSSKAANTSRAANNVALTGTGWLPPQGSTCSDPLPLTFPVVDLTGDTEGFIDDYSSAGLDMYSSYLDGDDIVYEFTLTQGQLLNGTVTTTDRALGLFIVEEEPDTENPVEVLVYENAGYSGQSVTVEDEFLPAGTYFLIISSYGYYEQSIDFTMNLTLADLPVPEVATNPSPADGDEDLPTALTLTWTNADYTETVDVWFGVTPEATNSRSIMSTRNMVKVLDDVPAVEEYVTPDLDPNTEYSWKVVCRNYTGETIADSVVTWTFTTIGSAPEAVTYTAPADEATAVALAGNLTWQAATGANGYYVYFSTDQTFAGVTPEDVVATSYAFSGLDYETTYYWKVIPYNAVGEPTEGIEVWSFETISTPFPDADLVFDGLRTMNQGMPIEPFYGFTITQNIYLQEEIVMTDEAITSISYLYNNNSAWDEDIEIYMGHTSKDVFDSTTDWITTDMTHVFSGEMVVNTSEPVVTIDLTTAFEYNEVDNLVVVIFATESGYNSSSDEFYNYSVVGNRSLTYHNDGTNAYTQWPNPTVTGALKAYLPVTGFNFGSAITELDVPVVTMATANGIAVEWLEVENAVSYMVYAADTPDAPEASWEHMTTTTDMYYLHTGDETMKFFKVMATTEAADDPTPAKRFGRN